MGNNRFTPYPMRRNQRSNGEARRRTGCWSCKAKHVRCTEERPICARCSRLGLQCQYGTRLLWQEDAVQRGIYLGREGAWSKDGNEERVVQEGRHDIAPQYFIKTTGDPIFLHTSYRHFEREVDSGDENDIKEDEVQILPSPIAALSQTSNSPDNEGYLLDYFTAAICPTCSLSPTDNPYLYFIAPMAFVYRPLYDAVISVAATERRLVNDRRFEKEAWLYKSRALKGLQMSIASGHISWPFIATILMLCFGDIVDGCNDSWRTHLRGGLTLINETHLQTNCTESQTLRKFCLMYFVAHDIMGRTAGASSFESAPYTWSEDDDLEEIDPLMGCSRDLLDIVNHISSISSTVNHILSSRALTIEEMARLKQSRSSLERALHTLQQRPPVSTTNSNIVLVAEAKRTTALLYLYDRFNLMSRSPKGLDVDSASHITRLIDSLIAQLELLPVTPMLLWPLFVLGNASPHNEEHRRFVLERLGDILRGRNLGSVRLARRLVERKFRDSDLQTFEYGGSSRRKAKSCESNGCHAGSFKGKWISLA